jgi:hypothetical protein
MAKAPPRRTKEEAQIDAEVNEGGPPLPAGTPLERMTELTRRIVQVPKSELAKTRPKKRKST